MTTHFNPTHKSFPADLVQQTLIKVCTFIWVLLRDFVLSSFRHFVEHLAGFVYESFPSDLVQKTMIKVCNFIWVLLRDFALNSFWHFVEHLAGSRIDDTREKNLSPIVGFNEEEDSIVPNLSGFDEDEKPEKSEFNFGFRFQFQLQEHDLVKNKGTHEVNLETKMSTSKYQFMSVQDFGGFVAEPEFGSFTVQEMFVEDDINIIKEKGIIKQVEVDKDLIFKESLNLDEKDNIFTENEAFSGQIGQRVNVSGTDEVDKDLIFKESLNLDEKDNIFTEKEAFSGQTGQQVNVSYTDEVDSVGCDEVRDLHEKPESSFGENVVLKPEPGPGPNNWLGEFIMRNEYDILDYQTESDESSDGFYSICLQDADSVNEPESENLVSSFEEEVDGDYIELEPNLEKELKNLDSNDKDESDSCFESSRIWEFDSDEEDDADVLLEHQELIGQMKMELRNSRTGGLPTILEECETPRVEEDYKPLQVNEKLEHRDQMAEIQKFYKSYNERMRKLDVLNYQTLQAINFLRMKHPEQTNTGENASLSAIKSILLPSLWPCKLRRIYADPTLKSITELHKDLEIVYVGHACLSWEMLYWQYKKTKELQLYDPQGYRSYNQIAIEFQQFHVLLRRFTEDELFQGPRVQNYTKQRCALRGLLQVPAIKDDNLKQKKAMKEEQEEAVSISTMVKMIKESMGVFWEFLHTDRDTTNLFLTIILQGSKAYLQDPADYNLFMDIKTVYQKKERKLKDLLRTGNCIVKKFQKQQETILDQHMFVSQVELRLVSRVLNLPRLSRDQLIWCQSKLNNIKFVDRKVRVEDSLFLLFPC
ncbi:uncharacterized protein LOC143597367 [Bidens hawaiensis]|uniref:uncharacterized protein LOC143597367 n=1 Tax=Bidens hawaiensis TaxID=980011 RepID=UPI004049F8B2